MKSSRRRGLALALVALLLVPATALAAKAPLPPKPSPRGSLAQLPGERGCLVDSSRQRSGGCATARALKGAGPFMGSRAVAVSPDGRHVYAAASRADAIAVFVRDRRTGALRQRQGSAGCVAARGAQGCGRAIGLDGPNSVAISPDGRFLYASSRATSSVTAFRRNRSTGALRQLPPGAGCVAGAPVPGCVVGRALVGPDVLVVSPDGENLYAGSFFGDAVAVFKRERDGSLAQAGDAGGCIAEAIAGCATAVGLGSPEGLAVSPDGTDVYVAAATSNAVTTLTRDPAGGGLSQDTGGGACIAEGVLAGCAEGVQLAGTNAVAVAPAGRDLYVTSLFSDSVTSFSRSAAGLLSQKGGSRGCLIYLRSAGCSFGRALVAPEGLDVSPDGFNVYAASFRSGAVVVLERDRESGVVRQKPGRGGCLGRLAGCKPGRALRGVSSVAVSPDGRNVYSTSFGSDAVNVFRRNR